MNEVETSTYISSLTENEFEGDCETVKL